MHSVFLIAIHHKLSEDPLLGMDFKIFLHQNELLSSQFHFPLNLLKFPSRCRGPERNGASSGYYLVTTPNALYVLRALPGLQGRPGVYPRCAVKAPSTLCWPVWM